MKALREHGVPCSNMKCNNLTLPLTTQGSLYMWSGLEILKDSSILNNVKITMHLGCTQSVAHVNSIIVSEHTGSAQLNREK